LKLASLPCVASASTVRVYNVACSLPEIEISRDK
jgi:hypothetical protein